MEKSTAIKVKKSSWNDERGNPEYKVFSFEEANRTYRKRRHVDVPKKQAGYGSEILLADGDENITLEVDKTSGSWQVVKASLFYDAAISFTREKAFNSEQERNAHMLKILAANGYAISANVPQLTVRDAEILDKIYEASIG